MVDDWFTKRETLSTKNAELKEANKVVGAYIPDDIVTFTSEDAVEIQKENALRCEMEMKILLATDPLAQITFSAPTEHSLWCFFAI